MKKNPKQPHNVSRRDFLQGTAAAGVGAAVAVSFPGAVAASQDEQVTKAEEVSRDKGYQVTSHVRKYYETLSN